MPGLLTDSGAFLCETLVIDYHLDEISGGKLFPKDRAARDFAFQTDGVASLLMESLFYRSHEKRREDGERSPAFIEKESGRANRAKGSTTELSVDGSQNAAYRKQYLGLPTIRRPATKVPNARPATTHRHATR